MILGVDVWVVVALAVAMIIGATVQGLVGLGVGLVGAPATAMVAPELMPGLMLWLALLLPIATLARSREEIDWHGLAWALPARVPGTVVGVILVATFSEEQLGIVIGVVVLSAVVLTYRAVRLPIVGWTLLAAGFTSGITGTATSIGGPPLAVLYQHRSPVQIRSTLAVYFVVGAALSLIGLGIAGALVWRDLALAALLVPCLLIGLELSRHLQKRIHGRHIRNGVLLVCAVSAVSLLVRSLITL